MQKLIYGVGALFAVLVVIGLALPGQSRFVVAVEIDAPSATVFAQVNDMRRFELWSPVHEVDGNAEVVFSGPDRGVGSTMRWDGVVVGSGTQTIVESQPYEYVETRVNHGEPGEAKTWFEIQAADGGTQVLWGFEHDYGLNLVGRYFGLMATGVLRRSHETAIANLKQLAESLPRDDFGQLVVEHVDVAPLDIAYRPGSAAPNPAAMSAALGDAYFEVLRFMDNHGLRQAGSPLAIERSFRGSERRFDAGIPISGLSEQTPRRKGNVRIGATYGGAAIRVEHRGAYRNLGDTQRRAAAYLAALGIERNGDAWEEYVSDPAEVPEAELLTWIYYPIKDR